MPLKRKRQKMFDSVTERIKNQTQGGLKINPETGVRYEEPLEEKHPGLTIGLMAAQPGTILEKVLAPSVYKGMAKSVLNKDPESLLAYIAPSKIPGPVGELITGLNDAKTVIKSPVVVERTDRLSDVYKRFIDPTFKKKIPRDNPSTFKRYTTKEEYLEALKNTKTNSPNGNIENIGGFSKIGEGAYFPPNTNASNVFHESLHAHDYGKNKINDWILSKIIDKEKFSKLSPEAQAYYGSSIEAPVHSLQLGRSKGIQLGQPFPGGSEFDKMLQSGYGGVPYFFKTSTLKDKIRFWNALNGTLFVKKQGGKLKRK